jgi:isopenicillin-N epimerase
MILFAFHATIPRWGISMPDSFWTHARKQMMLDPSVANLNTGSFGPLSRVVFERATELRRQLAAEPMDFYVRRLPPLLWEARERLAGFLHVDPRRLIFTANVSVSINLVASSLRLAGPGEILTTDHEYGSMQWCWERAAQRQGLTFRTFALPIFTEDPGAIVEAFLAAVSERTRLLFFSHILSPTGLVLPAKELCADARKRGILTVIDGAHAPAMLPLDIGELGCDFYGSNCHKWLLAPSGSGFLYFGPGQEDRLQPMQVSWGYHYEHAKRDERDEFGTTPRLRALELEGTRDPCPWLAVPTAIDFQAELGWDRIHDRCAELSAHARRKMTDLGLRLATPNHPALHGRLTAFLLPDNLSAAVLRTGLWEHRIEAPVIERPEKLMLRVSTHFYNTEEEIDKLASVLPELLERARRKD